jgi:inner membrane protein
MDPLAHTLFGATLAETGLKRRSRYATATLLIGANLPDIDVLFGLGGDDFALYMRRGLTHGIVALLVLPMLLAGAILLWHRWRGRAPPDNAGPGFNPRAILLLAFLSVWSHPLLDWLNTYGVRLLMPFDSRWFYGDTLFIVDPWFWLLTAAGVVLARSQGWRALTGWALLAVVASVLILGTSLVPPVAKLIWCVGVAAVVVLRWRRPGWAGGESLARVGLAGLALYIGTAYGLGRMAESAVADRFPAAAQVQANPAPATPFAHRVVVVEGERYRIVAEDGTVHELRREQPDEIVQRALASESIRGFVNWMRFPYWTVEEAADHWVVRFQDLRYQGPDVPNPRGIGFAQVVVPKAGAR